MRHILVSQEKQNHFFSHGGIFRAYSSLLGKYQKVSLRLTARAVPHEFPHHISSARCRKYFVEYFAHYLTLSLCQDCHANPFLFLAPICERMKRIFSGGIHIKKFLYFRGFLAININTARLGVVEIAHRSPTGPNSVSYFLPQTSLHILSQIIYKIL